MSKTIEELAKQYAEDMCPVGDYCGGVYDEQRNSDLPIYIDDAKSVLNWLFAKPLRDRLTEAEREAVRRIGYKLGMRGPAEALSCLVSLFGEELVYGPGMFGRE